MVISGPKLRVDNTIHKKIQTHQNEREPTSKIGWSSGICGASMKPLNHNKHVAKKSQRSGHNFTKLVVNLFNNKLAASKGYP